jgi:UDP-glucose 4-epimerase
MNTLITGASGFIGKRLVAELESHHQRFICIHNNFTPADDRKSGVYFVIPDLMQLTEKHLDEIFGNQPFSIVHLAWHSPRGRNYTTAANHLAQMAHILDVSNGRATKVVGIGSADEYGSQEGCLSPESPSKGLLSPYGWGKKCARELLKDWSNSSGKSCFWLRPFTVYGEEQRGNMLIPYAVKHAQARQEASFSDGLQERDFVHVEDVVKAIYLALQSLQTGFHEINLGWGKSMQVRAVLGQIADIFDAHALFKYGVIERRPDEPLIRFADIAAPTAILKWSPNVTIEEGLQRIARHYNNTVLMKSA